MRASRCTKAAARVTEMEYAAALARREEEKREGTSFRSFLSHTPRLCIVNLEAADIELDDDYRVARYSWKTRAREKEVMRETL